MAAAFMVAADGGKRKPRHATTSAGAFRNRGHTLSIGAGLAGGCLGEFARRY